MPSLPVQPAKKSAETAFREAFERLKHGKPEVLPNGARVSQNNVAKEAGVDPSALRKSRFPSLIAEIQLYLSEHKEDAAPSPRQRMLAHRSCNRNLRKRIDEIAIQRDHLASLLNEANAKIIFQAQKIAELEAKLPSPNITPILAKLPKKDVSR
ncbi:MAG: hypothetical protein ACXV8Q_03500 [Methylobacter sp.]